MRKTFRPPVPPWEEVTDHRIASLVTQPESIEKQNKNFDCGSVYLRVPFSEDTLLRWMDKRINLLSKEKVFVSKMCSIFVVKTSKLCVWLLSVEKSGVIFMHRSCYSWVVGFLAFLSDTNTVCLIFIITQLRGRTIRSVLFDNIPTKYR